MNGAAAPRVSVVIPALNEAANLPHVLARVPDWVYEIILVDGNSTDGTPEVARSLRPGLRVLEQNRRGKGEALQVGFQAARGDIIVSLDGDGSADGGEIERFVAALTQGADFAKGSRFVEGGGSEDITVLRGAGNRLLSVTANLLHGTRYTDLCYGYNAFWRHCLPRLDVDCEGFEVEALMNVRAARAGMTVVEVPSFEFKRLYGRSNLRTFRDGWRILRTLVRERRTFSRRPLPPAPASERVFVGGSAPP